MPQKALTSKGKRPAKLGKKAPRVNSNGKKAIQKKGKFVFKPKVAVAAARASHEMTREVNLKNELEAARRATQSGGKMLVVKPPRTRRSRSEAPSRRRTPSRPRS